MLTGMSRRVCSLLDDTRARRHLIRNSVGSVLQNVIKRGRQTQMDSWTARTLIRGSVMESSCLRPRIRPRCCDGKFIGGRLGNKGSVRGFVPWQPHLTFPPFPSAIAVKNGNLEVPRLSASVPVKTGASPLSTWVCHDRGIGGSCAFPLQRGWVTSDHSLVCQYHENQVKTPPGSFTFFCVRRCG